MTRKSRGRTEEEPRERLRKLLGESVELRARFAALHESVPPSAEELAEEDIPPDLEGGTEIRTTIEAILHDRLDPLIEALTRVVSSPAARRGGN